MSEDDTDEEMKLQRNKKHCEGFCRKTVVARCDDCLYVSAIAHNWGSKYRERACKSPITDKVESWLQCRQCGEAIA